MIYFTTYAVLDRIKKTKGIITEDYIGAINNFISNICGDGINNKYELVITNNLERAEQERQGESIGENKGNLVDGDIVEIYYNEAAHRITLTSQARIGLSLVNVYPAGASIQASGVYQPTLSSLIDTVTIIDVDLYDISQLISDSFEAINSIFYSIKTLRLIDCQIGNKQDLAAKYNLVAGTAFEQLELINCKLELDEIYVRSWGNLKRLDIQKLKAPNLRNIKGMFIATNIEEIRLYRCEFPKIESTENLFLNSNKLKKVNIIKSFWKSPIENTKSMFENCRALEEISGLSTLHMSLVETAENMFSNCESLKSVSFGDISFISLSSAENMFSGCKSLKYLDIKGIDWAEELINVQQMFKGIPEDCEIILKNPIRAVSLYNDFDNSMEQTRRAIAIGKYYRDNYEMIDEIKENTFNAFEKSVLINDRTLYTMILHVNITLGNEICNADTQINLIKSDENIESIKKTILKAKLLNDIVIMRPNCLIVVNSTGDVMNIISNEFIKANTCTYNVVYI